MHAIYLQAGNASKRCLQIAGFDVASAGRPLVQGPSCEENDLRQTKHLPRSEKGR